MNSSSILVPVQVWNRLVDFILYICPTEALVDACYENSGTLFYTNVVWNLRLWRSGPCTQCHGCWHSLIVRNEKPEIAKLRRLWLACLHRGLFKGSRFKDTETPILYIMTDNPFPRLTVQGRDVMSCLYDWCNLFYTLILLDAVTHPYTLIHTSSVHPSLTLDDLLFRQ